MPNLAVYAARRLMNCYFAVFWALGGTNAVQFGAFVVETTLAVWITADAKESGAHEFGRAQGRPPTR
ncbi:MAG: hypothetical protein QOF01_1418 [Thermomicrobiales bacterium]|nr:hypothetical protein [Thermomicrobiales bacterium]MEA2594949.1 hypothetical protein [Thermomicrobiales bacterium]